MIQIPGLSTNIVQASTNGEIRETRMMLETGEPFLFGRKYALTVLEKHSR